MPMDPAEALKRVGFDPEQFDTPEAFEEAFEKAWLKSDTAHLNPEVNKRITGKWNGAMRTALKPILADMEIEGVDLEKLAPLDVIKTLTTEVSKRQAALKEAKTDGATAPEIAKLQKDLDDAIKGRETASKLRDDAVKAYNDLDLSVKTEKHKAKENSSYARAFGKVEFRDDVSRLERAGMERDFREKYPVRYDDEGNELPLADKDGNPLKGPKVGEPLDLDTAFQLYAESEKLVKPKGGTVPTKRVIDVVGGSRNNSAPPSSDAKPVRKLHPDLR